MSYIPYGRQDISEKDIAEVVNTLKSDFITQGPKIGEFEQALCTLSTANYSIVVNSATSALHIACKALGVTKGDIVWTSPITFVASSNCALFLDATIDFVDIDEKTFNMSPEKLHEKLAIAKKKGTLPKVLIPVHMCGQSCEMEKIYNLSREYGFSIIEDASHAIGGQFHSQPVGSCKYADISVFSFHPVKIVTTGEGGACMTNSDKLARKLALYRSHGITRDNSLLENGDEGPWYYEQQTLGYNYRITDIQAALGISQLKRVSGIISKRNTLASTYHDILSEFVQCPETHPKILSAFHLYVIQVDPNKRKEIFIQLRNAEIGVNVHYFPVHLQPYYKKMGFSKGDFPLAEDYYARALSIPMYPGLTENEQQYVCDKIIELTK